MDLLDPSSLPDRFASVEELDDFLTRPSRALVDDLAAGRRRHPDPRRRRQDGADAGAPRQARRAVASASSASPASATRRCASSLDAHGVETIAVRPARPRPPSTRCPTCPTSSSRPATSSAPAATPALTWAMNAHVPALVAETLPRLAHRRLLDRQRLSARRRSARAGASEATPPAPVGEYAQSCLGRERMFEYFSARHGTPGRHRPPQLRDRHALRRAVRHRLQGASRRAGRRDDGPRQRHLAGRRQRAGAALPRATARRRRRRSTCTGPETLSVRWLARRARARASAWRPQIIGQEAPTALLSDTTRRVGAVRLSAGAARRACSTGSPTGCSAAARASASRPSSRSAMAASERSRRSSGSAAATSPAASPCRTPPAGTRPPTTGASSSRTAHALGVRDDGRPPGRDRGGAALRRRRRLDLDGAGRTRHGAIAASPSRLSTSASRRCAARGCTPVLDATPAGAAVYAPASASRRLRVRALGGRAAASRRRADAASRRCRAARRATRPARHRSRRSTAPPAASTAASCCATSSRRPGTPRLDGAGRQRLRRRAAPASAPTQVGPLVARRRRARARAARGRARATSPAASSSTSRRALAAALADWLAQRGFVRQRPFVRMALGAARRRPAQRAPVRARRPGVRLTMRDHRPRRRTMAATQRAPAATRASRSRPIRSRSTPRAGSTRRRQRALAPLLPRRRRRRPRGRRAHDAVRDPRGRPLRGGAAHRRRDGARLASARRRRRRCWSPALCGRTAAGRRARRGSRAASATTPGC